MKQATFEKAMSSCKISITEHGHKAVFNGKSFNAQSSEGPSDWTERMARQRALFSWALEEEDKRIGYDRYREDSKASRS